MGALISCAPYAGVNEDQQLPVINALLVAGTPGQALTVRWAGTPDDVNPGAGPAAGDVRLWITSSAGDSVAVMPTDTSARYAIALTPVSGVTYRLHGTFWGKLSTGQLPYRHWLSPRPDQVTRYRPRYSFASRVASLRSRQFSSGRPSVVTA
jgi:hypothetical protein